jgi:hypothetical protein
VCVSKRRDEVVDGDKFKVGKVRRAVGIFMRQEIFSVFRD